MHDASDSNSTPDIRVIQVEDAACKCETITSDCAAGTVAAVHNQLCESRSEELQTAEPTPETADVAQLNVCEKVTDNAHPDNVGTTFQTAANQGLDCMHGGNYKEIRKYIVWKCIVYGLIFAVYFVLFIYLIKSWYRAYICRQVTKEDNDIVNYHIRVLNTASNSPNGFSSLSIKDKYHIFNTFFESLVVFPLLVITPLLPFLLRSKNILRRWSLSLGIFIAMALSVEVVLYMYFELFESRCIVNVVCIYTIPFAILAAMCFPDTMYGRIVLPVRDEPVDAAAEGDPLRGSPV